MKRRAALLALTMLVATGGPGMAQTTCTTSTGSCAISATVAAGNPCLCATATGNLQGIAHAAAAAPARDALPQFCCTPAGRMGPFPNMNVAPGKACQASTRSGPAAGQACF